MRGGFVDQGRLFSYVSPEARVPANHPLRTIRAFVRDVLEELNRSLSRLYASEGRPSTRRRRPASAAVIASDGPSSLRPPPTIWCDCPS